ncbi:hypothetical protein ENSA5_22360 [Enhygromyxa salina]|uniref:Uncharacterized protein n=1 Tax=Enhygromyxa salina TaxID=215803 RepID=A0A2S9YBM3_9BACT|nr:hypothetical protein ENSA5_22360 [Enhygromyxa salina]
MDLGQARAEALDLTAKVDLVGAVVRARRPRAEAVARARTRTRSGSRPAPSPSAAVLASIVGSESVAEALASRPPGQRRACARPPRAGPVVILAIIPGITRVTRVTGVTRIARVGPPPRRVREVLADELAHDRVDSLRVREADLGFLRVHVHVDGPPRRLDEQARGRVSPAGQRVTVGLLEHAHEGPLAHDPAPHDHEAGPALAGRRARRPKPALDVDAAALAREAMKGAPAPAALEDRDHPAGLIGGGELEQLAAAVAYAKVDRGVDQRRPGDRVDAVPDLGRLAAQKFAPRGHAREQVRDLDLGPEGHPDRLDRRLLPGARAEPMADGQSGEPAADLDPRDRGDRGERLAAKAERVDLDQILGRAQLRGRVAGDRQDQILAMDAVAIVDHPDALAPAGLELDLDPRGPRVDRVLDQLLDDRARPLDDLAGRDLIGERRRQHRDARVVRRARQPARHPASPPTNRGRRRGCGRRPWRRRACGRRSGSDRRRWPRSCRRRPRRSRS